MQKLTGIFNLSSLSLSLYFPPEAHLLFLPFIFLPVQLPNAKVNRYLHSIFPLTGLRWEEIIYPLLLCVSFPPSYLPYVFFFFLFHNHTSSTCCYIPSTFDLGFSFFFCFCFSSPSAFLSSSSLFSFLARVSSLLPLLPTPSFNSFLPPVRLVSLFL